jgi:hypothetical protein
MHCLQAFLRFSLGVHAHPFFVSASAAVLIAGALVVAARPLTRKAVLVEPAFVAGILGGLLGSPHLFGYDLLMASLHCMVMYSWIRNQS